jgi:hypothetical protein
MQELYELDFFEWTRAQRRLDPIAGPPASSMRDSRLDGVGSTLLLGLSIRFPALDLALGHFFPGSCAKYAF